MCKMMLQEADSHLFPNKKSGCLGIRISTRYMNKDLLQITIPIC